MSGKTILRVLTNTERSAFACQRHWYFRYKEGLSRSLTPAPLRQGSLVHRGIEAWARSGYTLTVGELEDRVIGPWLESRREWAQRGEEGSADALLEDEDFAQLVTGILRNYLSAWATDATKYETIAVEPQVARWLDDSGPILDRPIVRTGRRAGKRDWRRWAYGGAIDRVVRDLSDGTYWFIETKTTKDTNLDGYLRKLTFDPQIRGYAWALREPIRGKVSPEVDRPIRVEGVIYDVVRKSVPQVPQLLQNRKGISRAKIDTTRSVYLEAILTNGFDPDEYREQLDALQGRVFLRRERYTFTDDEIEDFGRDAAAAARDVIRAESASYHPRQTQVCQGIARGCPGGFESICLRDGPLARQAFTVMSIRHAELTGDLAEPTVAAARGVDPPSDPAAPDLFAPARTETPDEILF